MSIKHVTSFSHVRYNIKSVTNFQPETKAIKESLLSSKLQSTAFVPVNSVLHKDVFVPIHKNLAPLEC